MIIDATFWVAVSFFIFIGVLVYFKIPSKIINVLNENINTIKNEVDAAENLKDESKNILSEYEKKISNAKAEVKVMLNAATDRLKKTYWQPMKSFTARWKTVKKIPKNELSR